MKPGNLIAVEILVSLHNFRATLQSKQGREKRLMEFSILVFVKEMEFSVSWEDCTVHLFHR